MTEGTNKIPDEELFQCLKSLNVPVRVNDLKVPTRDFMIRVFECCLRDVQIDITSPTLKPFNAIQHFDNPDMFQDAQMLTLLVLSINMITSADGLNITIKDITDPKPKRTKRILNYLIVFWGNCLKKYANFQDIENDLMEERKQADDLSNEIALCEGKYNECVSMIENMQPSQEELESCVSSKVEKIKEYEKQWKQVTDDYENLKKKEKDLHVQVSALDVNILSIKELISELEQLILPSPDRLGIDLQRIKDLIKNEEIRIREKELDLKEKKKNQDGIIKTQEENVKNLGVLREIQMAFEELSTFIKSVLVDNQNYQNEEEQLKKLFSELEMREKFKSIHSDKEAKIFLNTRKQKESIKATLEMIKKKMVNELKNLESVKSKKLQIAQSINTEADSIIEIIDLCQQAETVSKNRYAEYDAQMEAIHTSFHSDYQELKQQTKTFFEL